MVTGRKRRQDISQALSAHIRVCLFVCFLLLLLLFLQTFFTEKTENPLLNEDKPLFFP